MDKLYWLDQIQPQDRAKVGDKAFHLSRIIQRGYPVVPGFVISAEVLREFLETLNSSEGLIADLPHSSLYLDVGNWRQLQQVAGRLRQEIINATVPQDILNTILKAAQQLIGLEQPNRESPRSGNPLISDPHQHSDLIKRESAGLIFRPTVAVPTAKYGVGNISGLLESQFCWFNEEAIALALKRTWSELFRARSLLHWQRLGIDLQQINLAVLVQPFRNAIASGILHANADQWEIQATWGLGIAISSGEVLPDVYYIQPETGALQERQLGDKTLAYGFDDAAPVAAVQHVLAPDNISLVAYLLSEAQQKQYALPEEYLSQLIGLANQLVREVGTNFTVEWTISVETGTGTLTITQVNTSFGVMSNLHLLQGLAASAGRVMGSAYVIRNLKQKPQQLHKGVILVAPVIAPDWYPLLHQAGGIITEQGGLTSHGAILARELSIPAVVNVIDATAIIQNGERLVVDGDKGEVYRVTRGMGVAEDFKSKIATADIRGYTQIEKTNICRAVASSQGSLSAVPSGVTQSKLPGSGDLDAVLAPQDRVGSPDTCFKPGNPFGSSSWGATAVDGEPFRQFLLGETRQLRPLGKPQDRTGSPTPFRERLSPTTLSSPHRLPKTGLPHQRTGSPRLDDLTNALPRPSAPKSKIQNPLPMIATQLLVNLSQPSLIKQVQKLPVDGVGLLRSELMVLSILEGQHPNIWLGEGRKTQLQERWCEQIMQFARAFAPRPVFYRSLDWRSHELPSFDHSLKSSPQAMLGERGTFSYIGNPALFELELAAIAAVQKAGYSNIQLMLPFVRTVEEFSFCRQKVEQAMLNHVPQFQLWIMAEVPSILFLLPEYVKAGVQGISIGTNDLTQLLLGVDREQGHLAKAFNELHPAVMRAIAQLIHMATSAGIPCSICGQAPALYPEIIEHLVQWGITSISVEPEALDRTYEAIFRAEQKLILQAARQLISENGHNR